MNAPPQDPMQTNDEQSPFDAILARLDSYIANPKLVTPQTLMDLRDEVESAKADVEGVEQPDGENQNSTMPTDTNGGKPSLVVAIGKARGAH